MTISDADLYSHMAYEYVSVIDPATQNFEVPPLSKYLIGASILWFYNQRAISLIVGIFCLVLVFYLTLTITRSALAGLLAVSLTQINWLFVDQFLNAPQLEIFQLFFLLVFILLTGYCLLAKKVANKPLFHVRQYERQ